MDQPKRSTGLLKTVAGIHALLTLLLLAGAASRRLDPIARILLGMLWEGTPLAQSILLGLFWGLAPCRPSARFAAVALGGVGLWIALFVGNPDRWDTEAAVGTTLLTLVPLAAASSIALLFRRRGFRVEKLNALTAPRCDGLEFTIAQLFGITSVVAVLSALARALSTQLADTNQTLLAPVVALLYAGLIAVVFAIQALLLVWAALGVGRLMWRIPVVFGLLAAGMVLLYYPGGSLPSGLGEAIGISVIIGVEAGATLLVVRRLGYRLVRTLNCPAPGEPMHPQRQDVPGSALSFSSRGSS